MHVAVRLPVGAISVRSVRGICVIVLSSFQPDRMANRCSGLAGLLLDHVLDLAVLGSIGETVLTQDRVIAFAASGLPNTFVPGRNLLFFTFRAHHDLPIASIFLMAAA